MVTAPGERIVGKAISADSPAFFHVAHAEVNPELGRRLKRSKGPPFVPGKDRIEAARRAAVSTHASLRDPPSGVASRSRDPTSFEHAHGVALRGDGSAFRRRVGAAQGGKRVIQRRFNVSVPRARVSETAPALRERSER